MNHIRHACAELKAGLIMAGWALPVCFAMATTPESSLIESIQQSVQRNESVLQSLPGGEVVNGLVSAYHIASEKGEAEAAYRLAVIYRYGLGVGKDPAESLRQYKLAAERGHVAGLTELALLYEVGRAGVIPSPLSALDYFRRDNERSVELLRQAAEQNYPRAIYELSRFYLDGRGVKKDVPEALRLMERAYRLGYADAAFAVAVYYDNHAQTPAERKRVLYWYAEAAKSGIERALPLLERGFDQGDLEYGRTLAQLYEDGPLRDPSKAVAFWQRLYQLDDAQAAYRLARYAESGVSLPLSDLAYLQAAVRRNYPEALAHFEGRAMLNDSRAQHRLGMMYLVGDGVRTSRGRGIRYLQIATKSGNRAALTELERLARTGEPGLALFLAAIYERGRGVEPSLSAALDWWRRAAEQGAAQGQYRLAQMLVEGNTVPQNIAEAVQWFSQVYRLGNPVALDPLNRLAQSGNSQAQLAMGNALAYGFDAKVQKASQMFYQVEKNDTLSEIAERLGMGLSVLLEVNPHISLADYVQTGETLLLPLGVTSFHERKAGPYGVDAYGKGDLRIAQEFWEKAAAQGLMEAEMTLGQHFEGQNQPETAVDWYLKAARRAHLPAIQRIQMLANQGSPKALIEVCELTQAGLLKGDVLTCYIGARNKGSQGALSVIARMANDGHQAAQYEMGRIHRDGIQGMPNQVEAARWFALASDRGNAEATLALAEQRMAEGDSGAAISLYRRAVAQRHPQALGRIVALAERQDRVALKTLAEMQFAGEGAARNDAAAWKNLEAAVRQGARESLIKVVRHLVKGQEIDRALDLLEPAAQRDDSEQIALNEIKSLALSGHARAMQIVTELHRARDPSELTAWIKQRADKGDIQAAFDLAERYIQGQGCLVNPDGAYQWMQKAAEAGHGEAQLRLAQWYEKPPVLKLPDPAKAIHWYAKAASTGQPEVLAALERLSSGTGGAEALMALARFYEDRGQQQPASRHYEQAAERGHLDAMRQIANRYAEGVGVIKDPVAGFSWRLKSAQAGSVQAQIEVAIDYKEGRMVTANLTESTRWFIQAAMQGDKQAQSQAGHAYATGQGVIRNLEQALAWYKKAADQGEVQSQMALAEHYLEREQYAAALPWLELAAVQQHPMGMAWLGLLHEEGRGVPKDERHAIRLYQEAAKKGSALAQYRLGIRYEKGQGVPRDLAQATVWLQSAAEQGFLEAQAAMARLTADRTWLLRAAQGRHPQAQETVAREISEGIDVGLSEQDAANFVQCLARDPAIGELRASVWNSLGGLYAQGLGLDKDPVQAHCWFNMAASKEVEGASEARNLLEKAMMPEDIQAATRCARDQLKSLAALPLRVSPQSGCAFVPAEEAQAAAPADAAAPAAAPVSDPEDLFLAMDGQHYYLDLSLSGDDPIPFMVDTGATNLVFDDEMLGKLQGRYRVLDAWAPATLANGRVIYGQRVSIDEVTVGQHRIQDVRAFVCKTCMPLAGQSLLNHFDTATVRIDDRNVMRLHRRPPRQ